MKRMMLCLQFWQGLCFFVVQLKFATAYSNNNISKSASHVDINTSQHRGSHVIAQNVTPVSLVHQAGNATSRIVKRRAASKSDALAALQDFETSVAASKAEAVSAYDKIEAWCTAQKSAFATASEAQSTRSSELITEIATLAGEKALLEHEMETISSKIAEQQNSLGSTLSLQYSEETAFETKISELKERSEVMANVITDMKEKAFAANASEAVALEKASSFLVTAVGMTTISSMSSSTASPLSTLLGVLSGIHHSIEVELNKTKAEKKKKQAQFNNITTSYSTEITTLEESAETQSDRLGTAVMSLLDAKLARQTCEGLEKEDTELLMAITTVCSESDFAEKKKDKVHEQFEADIKDAEALLEEAASFLALDRQRRNAVALQHSTWGHAVDVPRRSSLQSPKTNADSQFKLSISGLKARKNLSTVSSLRRLVVARHETRQTPVECKKERTAATAEVNSARSAVQYLSDQEAREEANETAFNNASQAITECKEDDDLATESETLKKEVEDFGTAGETKCEEAESHLDSVDTKFEAYFDSIDAASSKLKAQVLLTRMRDTLKEWNDDGLDDVKQLSQMIGQVGDRALEIQNARDTRASELSEASTNATARKTEIQTDLDAAETRLKEAKKTMTAVNTKCTASTSSAEASDLQVSASPWKINGHLVLDVLKVVTQTLGIEDPTTILPA